VTEDACRQEILGTLELDRQEGLEHITFARGERPCHPSLAAHVRRTLMAPFCVKTRPGAGF
jgi:hypothetical protein